MFKLSERSLERLASVDEKLEAVVRRAITMSEVDFGVLEGLRTYETQASYVARGASKTMSSMHLVGAAVDLYAWVNRDISWEMKYYEKIAEAMKKAAKLENVQIVWGGGWTTFKDGVHFQLARTPELNDKIKEVINESKKI